jgi:hypothetical protein
MSKTLNQRIEDFFESNIEFTKLTIEEDEIKFPSIVYLAKERLEVLTELQKRNRIFNIT